MAVLATELAELRAAERFSAKLPATLRAGDGSPARVFIDHLSLGGFSAPMIRGVSISDVITVDLPNLEARTARIVRSAPDRIGCQFLAPLSDAELDKVFDDYAVEMVAESANVTEKATFPEPFVVPFPRWVRGFSAISLALASWGLVFALLRFI